jgi:hypothetical protein
LYRIIMLHRLRQMHSTEAERRELEKYGARARGGETNYFQMPDRGLTPPRNVKVALSDKTLITWDTSYAGDEPIAHYEIVRDGEVLEKVMHKPQATTAPFAYETAATGKEFSIVAVDAGGRRVSSDPITA